MQDTEQPADSLSLLIPIEEVEDVEKRLALKYLLGREAKRTMADIATELNVSASTLYGYVNRWAADGTLEQARQLLVTLKREEITVAIHDVLSEWPAALRRMINIVKSGTDREAVNAYKVLLETVIAPALTEHKQHDPEETAFIRLHQDSTEG